jgi:hypothetical protein
MIDIMDCIRERQNYIYSGKRDELLELKFAEGKQDCVFVAMEGFFDVANNASLIPEGYVPRCVFELGNVSSNRGVRFALFWFTKARVTECLFAVLGRRFERASRGACLATSGNLGGEYSAYIETCELYASGEVPKVNADLGVFFSVSLSELDEGRFAPSYYLPELRRIRKALVDSDAVRLDSISEVLKPRRIGGGDDVALLGPKNVRFPVDLRNLERGCATTVALEPGDVVLCAVGEDNRAIVYEGGIDELVYARESCIVVRPFGMSSEYLCFYLSSDIVQLILRAFSKGVVIKHLGIKAVSSLPVSLPSMGDAYYAREYEVLSGRGLRDYFDLATLRAADPGHVEMILDEEISARIRAYDEEWLRSFLRADIKELNTCYSHGAYKAAIILAGSILEAVLIDWLSEINHTNYFQEPCALIDRESGKRRSDTLHNYIEEIRYISHPDWDREADSAHEIRKMRNLVHAKLCVDESVVGDELARKAIECLDQVLKTRGVHSVRV